MEKTKKRKDIFKNKILIFIMVAFIIASILINVGLMITDIIYINTGMTLTACGLNNVEWLDFWKEYIAIGISFMGICLVYICSNKDRKKQLQEENAKQYLEEVRREEDVLVEVTQSFNMGMVYKALLQQAKNDNYEGRLVLADSRANIERAHVKFEILTKLCDDFKKCENCDFSPCADEKVMHELRDMFYDMEKHYIAMLEIGENCLEYLNQEQGCIESLNIEKQIQSNTEELIRLYKIQGTFEKENDLKIELEKIKENINNLENFKSESEEMDRFIAKIKKEINYINEEARPEFIKYCKAYIDMKKIHASELRTTVQIKHDKINEKYKLNGR